MDDKNYITAYGKKFNFSQFMKDIRVVTQNTAIPVITLMRVQRDTPFKILFATILTARTKDTTTIPVVKRLFSQVSSPEDIVGLTLDEIEKLIYPVGFYKTKARNMKKTAQMLLDEFDGKVPNTVEQLARLPGVGAKTANLVISEAFAKLAITVDVHVHRISNRLGIVETKKPEQTQIALEAAVPRTLWRKWNPALVAHGQTICAPISPKCSICPVRSHCKRVGVTTSR